MPKGLFYGGPTIKVSHEEHDKRGRVYEEVSVKTPGEIRIEGPVERVWELLIDLPGWEDWVPDIRLGSAVAADANSSWAIGGTRVESRFVVVEPDRELR